MKFTGIVFVVVCIALGFAQVPNRCTSPRVWEGKVYSSDNRGEDRYGRIYYDEPNERFLYTDFSYDPYTEEKGEYAHFYFHKQGYQLSYDFVKKTCYNYSLPYPFEPIGIRDNDTYVDTLVIGTNAIETLGLTVNVWFHESKYRGRVVKEFVASDGDGDEDCFPISVTEMGQNRFSHQSFFDLVLGVNPDHFTMLPKDIICRPPPPPPKHK